MVKEIGFARYFPFFLVGLTGCVNEDARATGEPARGRDAGGASSGGLSGGGNGGAPAAGAGSGAMSGTGGSADASVPKPDGALEPPPIPAGSCAPGMTATFDEIKQK